MSSSNGTTTSADRPIDVPFNIVNGNHSELIAYLVLNIWPSHFGLPLLLLVIMLSKKIQRSAAFLNMLVVWIIVGMCVLHQSKLELLMMESIYGTSRSSTLLLYAGKQSGEEPPKMLCLFQAALIYGMPPMTSTATLALVLQMFLSVRKAYLGEKLTPGDGILRTWLLLIAPYVALLLTVIATAVVGASNPSKISRNRRFFYCSVEADPLTDTMTVVAASILLATVILEIWTVVYLYRLSRTIKRTGGKVSSIIDLSFPIRIIAFGFYVMIALSLSLLSITTPRSPVPDLMISTAATVVIVIFGTQRDILHALFFWCHRPQPVKVVHEKQESIGTMSLPSRISIR
ncbi:hypothetical protein PC9H_005345 [Pleurotus ostreatus]|uniref:Uncharacterized protein n=1 Tax=Pleurotus ostreatus TaxID=5322 RepID=A0A8H6ZWB8_PLEOS|nr:uncharacterized protein PC9H_005345 [Pleurotus ostreatus]KAF7433395.1 hypothetical protein PC9H_005345 [Pleurotus ostreatus]